MVKKNGTYDLENEGGGGNPSQASSSSAFRASLNLSNVYVSCYTHYTHMQPWNFTALALYRAAAAAEELSCNSTHSKRVKIQRPLLYYLDYLESR